jgi:hypothetical protein
MAALVCLVGMARDASALVTFDLIWSSTTGTGTTGTNDIDADIGDILTLQVRMTTTQTLSFHGISLNFDTDLGNELNLISAQEWLGSTYGAMATLSNYAPLSPGVTSTFESTGAMAGRINTYSSGQLSGPLFLPAGTFVVGSAVFSANGALNAQPDGFDVFSGLFNGVIDSVNNNLNLVIPAGDPSVVFNNASVNSEVIPEPGTASLLGLGLVGLVLAGRRSRRS